MWMFHVLASMHSDWFMSINCWPPTPAAGHVIVYRVSKKFGLAHV